MTSNGYGWTPALGDADYRVRHAARGMLYGKTAGKVRRYGITRARPVRAMAALDGDVNRFITDLEQRRRQRRMLRRWIANTYGITYADLARVAAIRGRPSKELAVLRAHVALAFADIVDREAYFTQRGRRVARRTLLTLYRLDERQLARLLAHGRALRESDMSVALGRPPDAPSADYEPEDTRDGLEVAEAGDTPGYHESGAWARK
jgi:hypothetical protein